MNVTYILSIIGPIASILLSILAWYYKKDIDSSQKVISSLSSGMEELKAMLRVQSNNYEHLLREVQSVNKLANDNRTDINNLERELKQEQYKLGIEIEKLKNQRKNDV